MHVGSKCSERDVEILKVENLENGREDGGSGGERRKYSVPNGYRAYISEQTGNTFVRVNNIYKGMVRFPSFEASTDHPLAAATTGAV
ncbi:hypothetical protein LguiB_026146 [Lonicera macranthoides]